MSRRKSVAEKVLDAIQPCCAVCAYWNKDSQEEGECKRNSPQVVTGEDGDGLLRVISLWPRTDSDEWCGEFKGAQ